MGDGRRGKYRLASISLFAPASNKCVPMVRPPPMLSPYVADKMMDMGTWAQSVYTEYIYGLWGADKL